MTRGRRQPVILKPTEAVEITATTTDDDDEDELAAVVLDANDLYEDTSPVDEEDTESASKVAEPTIEPATGTYVTYKGTRDGTRSPGTISLTIPDDDTQADDPEALITDGTDFNLKLNVPHRATDEQIKWMGRHPLYVIEKS